MAPKFFSSGGAKGGAKGSVSTAKPAMTKPGYARLSGHVGGGLATATASKFTAKPAKGQPKGHAKGQGKNQGKGYGKAPKAAEENPGYQGERQRVKGGRHTGTVTSWKGPYGFIMPDAPIDHPAAHRRGGKIYLDQVDVESELSGVGAKVSFFLYCDVAGLGAQRVSPAKGPLVKQTFEKPKGKAKGKGAAASEGKGKGKGKKGEREERPQPPPNKEERESLADAGNGTIVEWKGNVGWLKPDDELEHPDARQHGRHKGMLFVHATDCEGELPLVGAQVMYNMYKDPQGLGAEYVQVLEQGDGTPPAEPEAAEADEAEEADEDSAPKTTAKKVLQKTPKGKGKGKGKDKGKGKAKGEKGLSGPDLPRERVSDEPITGEVVTWKGRVGWIKPSEPIDHPDAERHGGKLYAHINDLVVEEGTKMEPGQAVQCCVFKDSSGLGAEEIIPL